MLIERPTLEVIHVDREANIRGNSCMFSYREYKWSLVFYKK